MKKNLIFTAILSMISLTIFGQVDYTTFEIPSLSEEKIADDISNCTTCDNALDPALRQKTIIYKQSNIRDWLNQYFGSYEEQRRYMKNEAANNINLNAIVESIPIKFGYSSDKSNEYNYWNRKYIEWKNTRFISIDDIAYLFKANSNDQLNAWLECKKTSCPSAASYADENIFLDIEKIRDGRYNISLTNLSLAKIKIMEIQVDEVLEKISGKKFKVKKKVSNKGGIVTATYASKSTTDVNFIITLTYEIIGTDDKGTTKVIYKVKPELPEAPIGTIISTTLTYEQFLKINQIENLSSLEQIWLPCDGRSVSNGNYITKTPDLRGLFIRGANIMDVNETNHTDPVDNNHKNPDNTQIGHYQKDALISHQHKFSYSGPYGSNWGSAQGNEEKTHSATTEMEGGKETRPKNITVLYLIRVR